jgi:GDP-D-mannose 3',5'-epimerase
MNQMIAVVLGAGGFIGGHLLKRLKEEGYYVRGVDIKSHEYGMDKYADEFIIGDLRQYDVVSAAITKDTTEVYQLAADMGGAEYIFSGDHDADIMHNSAQINLNVVKRCTEVKAKVFYSSSACIYPKYNQEDPSNPKCSEESAYPAAPDSEYGWEKLFSERLYLSFNRNHGLDVRVARFHNIFGPSGTWNGGREKAPAALSRKIASTQDGCIDVFGDGTQTRSFLYIDECVEGIRRLMKGTFLGPVNIGSSEMVTINELVAKICSLTGKEVKINHIPGPLGVKGRNSDNTLIKKELGWAPDQPLIKGLAITYEWVAKQCELAKKEPVS